jgi:hypothetical protein
MSVNLDGKTCPDCKKGTLSVVSLQDDWEGILTCSFCQNTYYQWVNIAEPEEIKEAYKKGFNNGVKQAKEEILQDFSDYVNDMKIRIYQDDVN